MRDVAGHFFLLLLRLSTRRRSIRTRAGRKRGGGRVHLIDEGPGGGGNADSGHRARRHIQKITAGAVHCRSCHRITFFKLSETENWLVKKTVETEMQAPAEGIARNVPVRAVK